MDLVNPVLGGVALALAYSFAEPFLIQVNRLDLTFKKLPERFEHFTVLHLSDLHTRKFGLLEKRAYKLLENLEYDICCITGDLSTSLEAAPVIRRMLGDYADSKAVYVVTGNSEYKPWVDSSAIKSAYQAQGFTLLDNSNVSIERDDSLIYIAGCSDPYSERDNAELTYRGIDPDLFSLTLSHCPSFVDRAAAFGSSLVLSGHTHGGQFRLPGYGVIWSHMKRNKMFNDGLYSPEELSRHLPEAVDDTWLYVNRGLGTSRIHIRFNCRPQIALIKLHCST